MSSSPMPFTGTRNRFIIVFIDGGGGSSRYHSVIPRNNNGRHCRLSRKRERGPVDCGRRRQGRHQRPHCHNEGKLVSPLSSGRLYCLGSWIWSAMMKGRKRKAQKTLSFHRRIEAGNIRRERDRGSGRQRRLYLVPHEQDRAGLTGD